MARTPFYKVFIRNTNNPADDRDISSYISRFTYEAAVDVDNMLTLDIKDNAKQFLDDPVFTEGAYISFYFGYLQEKVSETFISRVANIQSTYADLISLEIQATDLGILLKKSESKKDWKNFKASDIAKEIASFYGLKPVVDDSETVHTFMPQGSKTDYNFMRYLSKIQKSGSWRFYIKSDTLYFTKLNLGKESYKTFNYNNGDGDVISFKPTSRETSKSNAARDTVVTTVNPFTNKPEQKIVNDGTVKDEKKLGDYRVHVYNGDGTQISGPDRSNTQKRPSQIQAAKNDPDRAGLHIFSPGGSEEAENVGNHEKKTSSMKELIATLEVEGNPDIMDDMIITIGNVSKRDIGNWYVTRAKHMITPDGAYITEMSLNRNAAQKAGGAGDNNAKQSAAETNKTIGDTRPETKKPVGVYIYDGDAKLLSSPKK